MRNIYLLERFNCLHKKSAIIGIFNTKEDGEKFINDRNINDGYSMLSELPLNKLLSTKDYRDNLGVYEHWHY